MGSEFETSTIKLWSLLCFVHIFKRNPNSKTILRLQALKTFIYLKDNYYQNIFYIVDYTQKHQGFAKIINIS